MPIFVILRLLLSNLEAHTMRTDRQTGKTRVAAYENGRTKRRQ